MGDIVFVGTVGEEELGDLRGVKALFRDHNEIDGFISIDGLGITRVVNQATGSHRYESRSRAPADTSSRSSACRARCMRMGRAIAKIAELQPPSDPKTTFTVGTVSGGTSVNAIAAEAKMAVDMRSNSTEELLKLEARLLELDQGGGGGRKRALEVGQDDGGGQADRRPAGRHRGDGFADRAGDPARGRGRHPRAAADLCRLLDRFQPRDVARHSRRHHRRRRGGRQLALAQRMVPAGQCLVRPAERAADSADADRARRRDQAGAWRCEKPPNSVRRYPQAPRTMPPIGQIVGPLRPKR